MEIEEFKIVSLMLRGILKLNIVLPFSDLSGKPLPTRPPPGLVIDMRKLLRGLEFRLSTDKHQEIMGLLSLWHQNPSRKFKEVLAISDILPTEYVSFRTDSMVVIQHSTQQVLKSVKLVDIFDASFSPRVMKFSEDGSTLHIAGRTEASQRDGKSHSIQTVFPLRYPDQSFETGLDHHDRAIDTNIIDMHIGQDVFSFIGTDIDLKQRPATGFFIHQVPQNASERLKSPIVDTYPAFVTEVKFSHDGVFIASSAGRSDDVYGITLIDRRSRQVRHEWKVEQPGRGWRDVRVRFSPGDVYLCVNDCWGPLRFYDNQSGTLLSSRRRRT